MKLFPLKCAVFILICLSGLSGCSKQPFPERMLWYWQPAEYFEESLPLGNGRIGACVYGGVEKETILLNEETLWAGGPVDPYMNPEAYKHLPAVRKALADGDFKLADKLVRNIQGKFSESYAPLGNLFIAFGHPAPARNYRRTLDIRNAVASTEYTVNNVKFHRETFVSHPADLLVIRLAAGVKGALSFTLSASSLLKSSVAVKNNKLVLRGIAPSHAEPNYRGDMPDAVVYDDENSMRFITIAHIRNTGGTVSSTDTAVTVTGADEAVILVSIKTSYNGFDKNPGTEGIDETRAAEKILEHAEPLGYNRLKSDHMSDFSSFFNRVTLDLGGSRSNLPTDERLKRYSAGEADNDFEALYFQFGRYLLISSSRPGGIPANLQGIWNPHLRPPWSSNYTININTEMNYWPAEATNLPEMHEPLLSFIGRLAETGAVTAKTFYNAGGWCAHHNSDLWAMSNPVGDFGQGHPCWANWNMGGTWLATHLWQRYLFTQDFDFLKNYAFPLMKGAAEFCRDILFEDPQGNLITGPSTSPENIYLTPEGYRGATSIATTADLAMIRELFNNTVKAGDLLEADPAFTGSLRMALNRLNPYKIGKKGNLQEWYYDWEDADPHHRHVSHLFALYPGSSISPETNPELAQAAQRSLELRGDGGAGWSKAWKISLWARLGDGNHAHKMLRTHLNYSDPRPDTKYHGGGTFPNLWDAHPPFQIDGNFGGTAGIAEMLIQSHTGEIHLLPALPDAWKSGSVAGLCARGGFTVNIAWENGILKKAEITSKSYRNVKVRYNNKVIDVSVKKNKWITIGNNQKK